MNYVKDMEALNSDLTPEVMKKIDDIIGAYRDNPINLIPVLEECQEILGYVPIELQEYIGAGLNIPGSKVYGVVTFYSFFSMEPKGRHIIKVCMGTACYVRGIAEVLNRIQAKFKLEIGETTEDRRFSLESVRCLGACGLAPVVVVGEDIHGGVGPDDILGILSQYE